MEGEKREEAAHSRPDGGCSRALPKSGRRVPQVKLSPPQTSLCNQGQAAATCHRAAGPVPEEAKILLPKTPALPSCSNAE